MAVNHGVVYLLNGSEAYQRLSWEALKKSINGLVNKVCKQRLTVKCTLYFPPLLFLLLEHSV